jgi:hypothetical protein
MARWNWSAFAPTPKKTGIEISSARRESDKARV